MKQKDFEARVLELWMTTRIPLTRANVQHLTRTPRDKVKLWLDALTVEGVLDADVDAQGEMIWSVRGAERPRTGAESVAEVEKMGKLAREVGGGGAAAGATRALALLGRGGALVGGGEQKSLVASGILSFVFGPLGWLYAAPLKEALPAVGGYALACVVLPHFLLLPIIGIVGPVSAALGVAYAWRHNQTGGRAGLFTGDDDK